MTGLKDELPLFTPILGLLLIIEHITALYLTAYPYIEDLALLSGRSGYARAESRDEANSCVFLLQQNIVDTLS